jgi:lysyl-tRNA synthetase class 2
MTRRPEVTERFELYITGREFGNGFSELNDAEEQASRFPCPGGSQRRRRRRSHVLTTTTLCVRSNTACPPPAAAASVMDRLMMLLTDSPSIRDVILFPALRREA